MLACIEVLEAGNEKQVLAGLKDQQALRAIGIIRTALFGHLLMLSMRPFDPVKKGDQHLAVAFELLKNEDIRDAVGQSGSPEDLDEPISSSPNWSGISAKRSCGTRAIRSWLTSQHATQIPRSHLLVERSPSCAVWLALRRSWRVAQELARLNSDTNYRPTQRIARRSGLPGDSLPNICSHVGLCVGRCGGSVAWAIRICPNSRATSRPS